VICTNGQCSSTGCRPGFQDCNNNLQDGCEQPSGSSVTNCGACGRACSSANVATLECTNNACTSSCQPGFANCRRPTTGADDGCEQNITTNNQNCGSCGNACSDQGTSGGLVCAGSHCGCTGDAQCRVGTGSGTATCNVAARRCACDGAVQCNEGETCQRSGNGRACRCNNTGAACAAGQVCCDTPAGCRNLLTDPTSCGACGLACPAGFTCSSGQCVGGPPDAGQVDSGQPDTGTLVDAGVDSGDDAAPDVSPIDSSTD